LNVEKSKATAEIQFTKSGPVPVVQLTVPFGTKLTDITSVLQTISARINPGISPRGCNTCTSGNHLIIQEQFENVVRVNLETGQVVE
jgi:hypothetical protein